MLSYLVQYAVFILHSFADLPCVPIFTSTRYYNDNYFYNVGIYLVVVLIQIMNEGGLEMQKDYSVYKARLQYHEFNEFIGTFRAYNCDDVKRQLKADSVINPFYAVIIDTTDGALIIEHNKHLDFVTKKSGLTGTGAIQY